jgi:drug/metabolite transporter (DMT)-like permease
MISPPIKTLSYVVIALIAFAGNSVLCRLALAEPSIDASSFTVIRLASGIIVLVLLLGLSNKIQSTAQVQSKGSWLAALMLFVYALTFSYAYISLDTGIGALILFGSVQLSMVLIGIFKGNKLHIVEWLGVITAFIGFVYLVFPSLSTPSLFGFILMTAAGIAWGVYSLLGRASKNPLADTAYNFLRTTPLVIILILWSLNSVHLTHKGVIFAILSGALASGVGYTIWYSALRGLSVTQAAVVQLLVPIIAAVGGVLFASELISIRLMISSLLVLGGILMVVLGRKYFVKH